MDSSKPIGVNPGTNRNGSLSFGLGPRSSRAVSENIRVGSGGRGPVREYFARFRIGCGPNSGGRSGDIVMDWLENNWVGLMGGF